MSIVEELQEQAFEVKNSNKRAGEGARKAEISEDDLQTVPCRGCEDIGKASPRFPSASRHGWTNQMVDRCCMIKTSHWH